MKEYKILHLEDDPEYADAFTMYLENAAITDVFFKVLSVRNLDQAVEAVERERQIDFIFIDLKLTGHLTGVDFLKIIRNNSRLTEVPKFIMSDLSEENVQIGGKKVPITELSELGMSKFLSKALLWKGGGTGILDFIIGTNDATKSTHYQSESAFNSFLTLALIASSCILIGAIKKDSYITLIGFGTLTLSSILLIIAIVAPKPKT